MLSYMVRTSVLPLSLYFQQIPYYIESPVVKTTWTVKKIKFPLILLVELRLFRGSENIFFFDTIDRIYFVHI